MSHLALGDYVYQGPYLQRLTSAYPNIQFDVWLDDCRTRPKSWHAGRSKLLTEWLCAQNNFGEILPIASNNRHRESLIRTCQLNSYDVIFFIASHRADRFAKFAKKIAPNGFVAGLCIGKSFSGLLGKYWLNRVNAHAVMEGAKHEENSHITLRYNNRYAAVFGAEFADSVAQQTLPIDVPETYLQQANTWLLEYSKQSVSKQAKVILINPISTSNRRNYSWIQLKKLICALNSAEKCHFVINLPPDRVTQFGDQIASSHELDDIDISVFSAQQHFFQLPAMIKAADCLITVETATMHLASCLGTKQIVLMRNSAMHWRPLQAEKIHYTQKRVDDISAQAVAESVINCLGLLT